MFLVPVLSVLALDKAEAASAKAEAAKSAEVEAAKPAEAASSPSQNAAEINFKESISFGAQCLCAI